MILSSIRDALAAGDADRYRTALPALDRWLEVEPAEAAPALVGLIQETLDGGGSGQAVAALLVRLAEATDACAELVPIAPLEKMLEALPDDAYTARIALAAMITRVHPAGIMVPKLDRLILASEAVLQSGAAGGAAGERLGRLAREVWLNLGLGEPADLAALAAELTERHGWALATVRAMAEAMPEIVRRRPETADTMLNVLESLARGAASSAGRGGGPTPAAIRDQVESSRRRARGIARLSELARATAAAIAEARAGGAHRGGAGGASGVGGSAGVTGAPPADDSVVPIERLVAHLLSGEEAPQIGPDALSALTGDPTCEVVRALEDVVDRLTVTPGGGRRLGRALDHYATAAAARPECARAECVEGWLSRASVESSERRCTVLGVLAVVAPGRVLDTHLAEFVTLCAEHSSPPRAWIAIGREDPEALLTLVNAVLSVPAEGDTRLRADLLDGLVSAVSGRPDLREEALARLCDSPDAADAPLTSAVSEAIRRLRAAGAHGNAHDRS